MPDEKDIEAYRAGEWRGYARWQCPRCPWDSLEASEFIKHLKGHGIKVGPANEAPASRYVPRRETAKDETRETRKVSTKARR